MARKRLPIHPGEVLREEYLIPLELSAGALAKACGVPRTRIERIANEETAITADTALRLAKALGTSAQLWLNLQNEICAGRKAASERNWRRSARWLDARLVRNKNGRVF